MQSLSSGAVGDYRSMLASASGPPPHSVARPGFCGGGHRQERVTSGQCDPRCDYADDTKPKKSAISSDFL